MTERDQTRLFQAIESDEFAVRLNIAGTSNIFLELLSGDVYYEHFLDWLNQKASQEKRVEAVLNRILDLVRLQVNLRYENPYDVALAAYVWALSTVSPGHGRIAAELAVGAPQTWWAEQIAASLLEKDSAITNREQVVFRVPSE